MNNESALKALDQFLDDVILKRPMLRGYYRLMYIFKQIMDARGINYFAHSGTMLGVVRHKGMIPWDDDLDVMIEESDEKALLSAVDELADYGIILKPCEHEGLYQFKCENKMVAPKGLYLQIDVFVGRRELLNDKEILHYKSPKFKEWFSKRYIYIDDLYPLKDYAFGSFTVKGIRDYRPYFENSGFALDEAIVARHQGFDRFIPRIEELKELGVYPIRNHPILESTPEVREDVVCKPLYLYRVKRPARPVLTYGTYDLFHVGHVRLLKRLARLGDALVVGLSTDEFNASKGKKSFYTYEQRKEILESCGFVDFVFPEADWAQKSDDVKKYGIKVFGMGDDWEGKFDELKALCDVVYLPRTEDISTTDIKTALAKINADDVEQLEKSLHSALDVVVALAKSVRG